jgi:hypothetical protein
MSDINVIADECYRLRVTDMPLQALTQATARAQRARENLECVSS